MLTPLFGLIESNSTPDDPTPRPRIVALYADAAGKNKLEFEAAPSCWIIGEVPSGVFDGVNKTFSLAHAPISNSIMLFLNGSILYDGADYTVDERTLTMTATGAPAAWSNMQVAYLTRE